MLAYFLTFHLLFAIFGRSVIIGSEVDKLKTLLIMVDNRDLENNLKSQTLSYFSLTSAINYEYAKRHGYDFILFKVNNKNITTEVFNKYGMKSDEAESTAKSHMKMGWASETKQTISVFNTELRQFRATPWAKIALLWNLVAITNKEHLSFNKQWDYIFYLDSDFVINPTFHSRSLSEAMISWSTHSPKVSQSPLIFFSNAPYSHRPCTGGMLVQTHNDMSSTLLADWWNWNIPYNNFAHEYEQAALWEMLDKNHPIKTNMIYLHSERQFPPCNDLWLCHLGHPWQEERMRTLHDMAENTLKYNDEKFSEMIDIINTHHTVNIDSFAMADIIKNDITKLTSTDIQNIEFFSQKLKEKIIINSEIPQVENIIKGEGNIDTLNIEFNLPIFKTAYEHQFPGTCSDKKALLLQGFQSTGLGTVICWQLSALLKKAMNMDLVLIIDEDASSPYLKGCPDTHPQSGRWGCLFQPVTNCTKGNVAEIALTVASSAGADDGVVISQEQKDELTAFLSRPSDFALQAVTDVQKLLHIDDWALGSLRTAGVHVRQRSRTGSGDWVRGHSHEWSANDLLHVLLQISKTSNVSNFVVISDDPLLVSATSALSTSRQEGLKIAYTSDVVKHATNSDQDCVRDSALIGCEKDFNEKQGAYSVMVDLAMISRTNVFAGTKKSAFSQLMKAMVMGYNQKGLLLGVDEFDLDNVCTKQQVGKKSCQLFFP